MSAIRNSCVARGTFNTTAGTVLYTVPASTVLLLKDVRLWATGGNTSTVQLFLNVPGVVILELGNVSLGPGAATGYAGWIALNAADQVYVQQSSAISVAYWISGALLPYDPSIP